MTEPNGLGLNYGIPLARLAMIYSVSLKKIIGNRSITGSPLMEYSKDSKVRGGSVDVADRWGVS